MSLNRATAMKNQFSCYSFNKSRVPFPENTAEKIKPPTSTNNVIDSRHLFKKQELTIEEQAIDYMNNYKKAERILSINFYTGGGAYKKGVMDSLYKGFNPMKL